MAKLRRSELVEGDPSFAQVLLAEADQIEKGTVGVQDPTLVVPEDDAEHVRIDDPSRAPFCLACRTLRLHALGDVERHAQTPDAAAVCGEQRLDRRLKDAPIPPEVVGDLSPLQRAEMRRDDRVVTILRLKVPEQRCAENRHLARLEPELT